MMLSKILCRIKRVKEILDFFYVQRIEGFVVSSNPCFGSKEAGLWFEKELFKCKKYLEFGTGGSTCLAAKYDKKFIAVEGDKCFLRAVKKKIRNEGCFNDLKQTYKFADIGITAKWGRPLVFLKPSVARLNKFRKYSDFPFNDSNQEEAPDLILIDGRFRVACALKALKALKNRTDWTLVIDDYLNRPNYHIVEKFAEIAQIIGVTAVFKKNIPVEDEIIDNEIKRFELDPS